jgi:hypothetical protein
MTEASVTTMISDHSLSYSWRASEVLTALPTLSVVVKYSRSGRRGFDETST